MFLIGFVTGAMVGGTLAIAFHCLIIIGKESDRKIVNIKINKEFFFKNITSKLLVGLLYCLFIMWNI